MIAVGIEQQYYFTAHIPLVYFTENISELDRDYLASMLTTFNDKCLETEPEVLTIRQV